MTSPIAKHMPDKATYEPYKMTMGPVQARALASAVKSYLIPLKEVALSVAGIEISRMKPNGTGRKIDVRARVEGKSVGFSVFPYEGRRYGPRTKEFLLQEVLGILVKRKTVQKDDHQDFLSYIICTKARNLLKEGTTIAWNTPWINTSHVEMYLVNHVHDLVPDEAFDGFYDKIVEFVGSGTLDKKYDDHQVDRALDQYRDMALHALRHGAGLDAMKAILDEAVVKVTMES